MVQVLLRLGLRSAEGELVSKFYLSLRKSVYLQQHNATFQERGASQSRLVPL